MAKSALNLAEQATWPSWASGAVLLGNGSAAPTALAPGASGNVLTSNGSAWVSSAPPSATALETVSIISASGASTLTTSNSCYVYSGSAAATWTLPSVSGNAGRRLLIENRGSTAAAAITLVPSGTDFIWFLSAIAALTIGQGGSAILICDGTYWNILSTDVAHDVIGVLPIANGGTGLSAVGANGTVLTSNGAAAAWQTPALATSLVANVTSVSTGPTKILSLAIPANTLAAGSAFVAEFAGVQSAAGTVTGYLYEGVNGASTDVQAASLTNLPAITGTSMPFYFHFALTVRTIGTAGTCIASGMVAFRLSTTAGYGNAFAATSTYTINTTVQNFLTLEVAASAGTFTASTAFIRQLV